MKEMCGRRAQRVVFSTISFPMHRLLPITLLLCAFGTSLVAQQPAPTPAATTEIKPLLKEVVLADGDAFVFLGDSITHQCLYTQYVEDFFYTRFPEKRIRFHNAGVGGDRAKNALDR